GSSGYRTAACSLRRCRSGAVWVGAGVGALSLKGDLSVVADVARRRRRRLVGGWQRWRGAAPAGYGGPGGQDGGASSGGSGGRGSGAGGECGVDALRCVHGVDDLPRQARGDTVVPEAGAGHPESPGGAVDDGGAYLPVDPLDD